MDATEQWLRENDPEYEWTSRYWKHVQTGEYVTPRQEIPWGDAHDLSRLVERNSGSYVSPVDWVACARCGYEFVPQTPWHRYCSRACKHQARRRRQAFVRLTVFFDALTEAILGAYPILRKCRKASSTSTDRGSPLELEGAAEPGSAQEPQGGSGASGAPFYPWREAM